MLEWRSLASADAKERQEHDPEKWEPVFGKDHAPQVAPLRHERHAPDDAAGAQIVERRLRRRERALADRDRRRPCRRGQGPAARGPRRACRPTCPRGHRLDGKHGDRHGQAAAEQAGHHHLAAAHQHAGGELQRALRADEVAGRRRSRRSRRAPPCGQRDRRGRKRRRRRPRGRRCACRIDVGDDRRLRETARARAPSPIMPTPPMPTSSNGPRAAALRRAASAPHRR